MLFVAILVKLLYIQIWQYDDLHEKALTSWNRQVPQQSERGLILDREGKVLVTNQLHPSLHVMPGQLEDKERLIQELSARSKLPETVVRKEVERKSYLNHLRQTSQAITKKDVADLQMLGIEGLYSSLAFKRSYPYNSLLASVLGFTGVDGNGLAGVEYTYDHVLKGLSGSLEIYTDAKGKRAPSNPDEWNPGRRGYHLQLTIDLTIQQLLEAKLHRAMEAYQAKQAIGVVMNPKTGELLAVVSLPSYHPEKYQQASPDVIYKNLPVTMTFEPGSTFKIITLSAALEEKLVDLDNEHFYDPGYAHVAGHRLRCWKRQGHGSQTFLEVVENSCNPGFIELGHRLGEEKLQSYIRNFGFGSSTQSGLAGEQKGILFSREAYGPLEHATTSFGQGISVTPVQQVAAIAAAINGGHLVKPYFVAKTIDPYTNEVVAETFPELKRRVISPETSKTVRETLGEVVAHGSGQHAYRSYLSVGGKTGTAQKAVNGRYMDGEYIVSFIGFAPVQDPEYLVYVAIDAPEGSNQFGGTMAAPIVGELFEDIAEDAPALFDKKKSWNDVIEYTVPQLIGETKESVLPLDYPFQLIWHGDGKKVIDQLPKAGEPSRPPYTIHLYTD